MNHYSHPIRRLSKYAFTLVELLIVVAIIAVVGAGVAVTYGRKMVDDSRNQLTLHEMHEIKKAFLRFHSDNYMRLQREMNNHEGHGDLPTAAFRATFHGSHVDDPVFDGRMELFETYGLWFLMLRRIPGVPENTPDPSDYDEFPQFALFDVLTGEGWNGPYLDVASRKAWTYDGIDFPQIADKHGGSGLDSSGNALGVYRLLYYEHCEDLGDLTEPIYRRLLLVAPLGNTGRDELKEDELLLETGNLRGGAGAGRLNPRTGAFENNPASEIFILELLNMDQVRE